MSLFASCPGRFYDYALSTVLKCLKPTFLSHLILSDGCRSFLSCNQMLANPVRSVAAKLKLKAEPIILQNWYDNSHPQSKCGPISSTLYSHSTHLVSTLQPLFIRRFLVNSLFWNCNHKIFFTLDDALIFDSIFRYGHRTPFWCSVRYAYVVVKTLVGTQRHVCACDCWFHSSEIWQNCFRFAIELRKKDWSSPKPIFELSATVYNCHKVVAQIEDRSVCNLQSHFNNRASFCVCKSIIPNPPFSFKAHVLA